MLRLVVGAVGVFVVTNLDGLVLLTLLFATPTIRTSSVVVGQYLGLTIVVAISAAAAFGLYVVPRRWAGLLGVIPIALGLRALVRRDDPTFVKPAVGLAAVILLIVSDGTDNVAVYTPVFRHLGPLASLLYVSVFAVIAVVWCALGSALARHKRIASSVERWGHLIVPIVFILIGLTLLTTAVSEWSA